MQRIASLQGPRRLFARPQSLIRRRYSTPNSKPTPSNPSTPLSTTPASSTAARPLTTRIDRVLSRLPPSMQKYTSRLRDAPVSHVVAFLMLHELTAVVPLLGLFGLFHYLADNNPVLTYMSENYGEQFEGGVSRFERYFKKKGWLAEATETSDTTNNTETSPPTETSTSALAKWSDARYRIVVEVGLAYAVTKLLLPLRVAASLSATPWFARVLQKLRKLRK